jgi:hypothetical protein
MEAVWRALLYKIIRLSDRGKRAWSSSIQAIFMCRVENRPARATRAQQSNSAIVWEAELIHARRAVRLPDKALWAVAPVPPTRGSCCRYAPPGSALHRRSRCMAGNGNGCDAAENDSIPAPGATSSRAGPAPCGCTSRLPFVRTLGSD